MGGRGSGGARIRSGPPPQRNALRRDKDGRQWHDLPASGREGDAPAWPLSKPRERELELWAREWQRPQAIMWERNGLELQVALYVRQLYEVERGKASGSMQTLLARRMDDLGLTTAGLERNRWAITESAPTAAPPKRAPSATAKNRLAVLQGGNRASA